MQAAEREVNAQWRLARDAIHAELRGRRFETSHLHSPICIRAISSGCSSSSPALYDCMHAMCLPDATDFLHACIRMHRFYIIPRFLPRFMAYVPRCMPKSPTEELHSQVRGPAQVQAGLSVLDNACLLFQADAAYGSEQDMDHCRGPGHKNRACAGQSPAFDRLGTAFRGQGSCNRSTHGEETGQGTVCLGADSVEKPRKV